MKKQAALLISALLPVFAFPQENENSGLVDSFVGMLDSKGAMVDSARRALNSGMPALAQIMLERVEDIPGQEKEAALVMLDTYISEGRYEAAEKALARFDSDKSANMDLRRAVVSMASGKGGSFISEINPDDLEQNILPWYYITLGLIDFDKGDFERALLNFEKAKESTMSASVKVEAEILSNLCLISRDLDVHDLKKLSEELALKSSVFMGMPAGAQFTKQHAIVLDRMGLKKEAVEVIENQLQTPLMADSDRDELRLVASYIEPSADRRRAMVSEIIRTTRAPEITDKAVYMLRQTYESDSSEYAKVLEAILSEASDAIRDRILLENAYVSLRRNDYKSVDEYAAKLLSDYPASVYILDAYRLLAFSAFASDGVKKPDYRLAASYLLKVASLDKNPTASNIAKFVAADSYFLEKDYETASEMYYSLLHSDLPEKWKSGAFGRAVESLLALNKADAAVALVDNLISKGDANIDDIWRAEWAIASHYRGTGDIKKALQRIDRLLAGPISASADAGLRARLLWLQARMAENLGDYNRALSLSDSLVSLASSGRLDLTKELADTLVSNTMLMRARLLANLGNLDDDGAFAAYEALREAYPYSDAAQLSYLYEARNFASRGVFTMAQQHCKTLADNFPEGKYADTALFEAAIYSQKLGLESDYQEAMKLLDRLVKKYPESPKVFYAKLAYAQILRLMGDFANAAAVYKNIIEDFPEHPRIVSAHIGLGDCLFAASQESDAAAVFERIYSAPNTPRAANGEVAFKWGYSLYRAGRKSEAARIWWVSSEELLDGKLASKDNELGVSERYWIGRSLYHLARFLESEGEKRSAIAAYELLIKHNLPFAYMAREKLSNNKEK